MLNTALVQGSTLEERLASGRIPWPAALGIGMQIVEALDVAHEHGIIHRDLKPANILMRPNGVVKVLDFGLAKALDSRESGDVVVKVTEFTDALTVIGTAPYMSPEQARGTAEISGSTSGPSGASLYEMLTGRRTFEGDTRSDLIAAVIEREPD